MRKKSLNKSLIFKYKIKLNNLYFKGLKYKKNCLKIILLTYYMNIKS